MITKVTVENRRYKAGYIIRKELWQLGDEEPTPMVGAYNFKGQYIGSVKDAKYLIKVRDIKPIKAKKGSTICSIGFCKREKKWYGWSHRAICGFGIGNKLFDENYKSDIPEEKRDKIPFIKHGSKIIKNMKEAKQAAINFAESVS